MPGSDSDRQRTEGPRPLVGCDPARAVRRVQQVHVPAMPGGAGPAPSVATASARSFRPAVLALVALLACPGGGPGPGGASSRSGAHSCSRHARPAGRADLPRSTSPLAGALPRLPGSQHGGGRRLRAHRRDRRPGFEDRHRRNDRLLSRREGRRPLRRRADSPGVPEALGFGPLRGSQDREGRGPAEESGSSPSSSSGRESRTWSSAATRS